MKILITIVVAATGILSFNGCYYDNEDELYNFVREEECDTTNVTYTQTIASIFSSNCNNCHSTSIASGNVVTDNYNDLAANIDAVWSSINYASGYTPMPQGGNKLSDCNLTKIKKWMDGGKLNN